jgi:hypothetical protein
VEANARAWICRTCGAQVPPSAEPPPVCAVCSDERQYVPPGGPAWTTMAALRETRRNAWQRPEPGLYGIGTEPAFAIGQRALLVRTAAGNVLWDCVALLDDATLDLVRALGGLRAIALSHPHFQASAVAWGHAFDAPVLVHADDRRWIQWQDRCLEFWQGETRELGGGATVIRCGGHFEGSAVLHWAGGAGGRGALLVGDTLMVGQDLRSVSFMRSYPNLIPLSAVHVRRIVAALEPFPFERIYGGWWEKVIAHGADRAVRASAERYVAWLEGRGGG